MENPGLKRYISTTPVSGTTKDQHLKVLHRRTANEIMPAPKTLATDGYQDSINDLYSTQREDVTTPPPLAGGTSTDMVPATNGEQTLRRSTDMGGYRAAFDPNRGEWLYSVDDPNYFERDPAPSKNVLRNKMFGLKDVQGESGLDQPHYHQSFQACRGCEDRGMISRDPEDWLHLQENQHRHHDNPDYHLYEPVEDLPPGVRLAGAPVPELENWETEQVHDRMFDPGQEPCSTCWVHGGRVVPQDAHVALDHEWRGLESPETLSRFGGAAETMVPGQSSQVFKATPTLHEEDPNALANERRIDTQKQVGGGEKENPAYELAQERIRQKMQVRRAHPLHQGSSAPESDEEFWARQPDVSYNTQIVSPGMGSEGDPSCETCYLQGVGDVGPEDHDRVSGYSLTPGHEFKPIQMEHGQRYSSTRLGSSPVDDDEEREDWEHEAGSGSGEPVCEGCYLSGMGMQGEAGHRAANKVAYMLGHLPHDFKPLVPGHGQRYSSASESDEDFWARQPDVENSRTRFTDGAPVVVKHGPTCETCYLQHDMENVPEELHDEYGGVPAHPFKPLVMERGQRYSSAKVAELQDTKLNREENLRHFIDTSIRPTRNGGPTWADQPMIDFKHLVRPGGEMDAPADYDPEPACETCWLEGPGKAEDDIRPLGPDAHKGEHGGYAGHPFKPFHAEPGQRFSSVRLAEELDPDDPRREGDPRAELEGLFHSLPEAGSSDERPWTTATHQQKSTLAGHGFERHTDSMGEHYWVKGDGANDYYIAPSREEPREGYWETSIGPVGHWAEDSEHTVEPTLHADFDNALQRVTDPDGWYREHMADYDADMLNRGKRVPGKMKSFIPAPRPHNPGLQSLNSIASWSSFLRQGAQVPSDDPVYPYSGRVDPDDTTDLDNLQDEDDTFRPHHPDVDRVMNQLQGLPDMSRNDPRLMKRVNELLDEAPDTEEGNRGADALAGGLNTIFDSMRETEDMPREERLQRGKDAIDAHFETAKLTHKQHVKQLHDDWLARGGHKTGEPRPVERFSPRYTKPQQIVPDPSSLFPELETPIYHVGKCESCGRNLYDSAGSSGDPRGALGDHTLGTIDAAEYDATDDGPDDVRGDRRMHGPSALICPLCDSESERRNAIEDKYRGHKAGDKTGDGYWGWPEGADRSDRSARRFIPTTYDKDRKGKWHNPGEQMNNCPECDQGITGFHRRQAASMVNSIADWSKLLRRGVTS